VPQFPDIVILFYYYIIL